MKYIIINLFLILFYSNFSSATVNTKSTQIRVTSHLQIVNVDCIDDKGAGKLTIQTNSDLGGAFYMASLKVKNYFTIENLCKSVEMLRESEAYVTLRITNEKGPEKESEATQANLISVDLAPFND